MKSRQYVLGKGFMDPLTNVVKPLLVRNQASAIGVWKAAVGVGVASKLYEVSKIIKESREAEERRKRLD